MKVREMIDLFNKKEMKYKDMQERYAVSRDLIQARLKKAGIQWNNNTHQLEGEPSEDVLEMDLADFLARRRRGRTPDAERTEPTPKAKTIKSESTGSQQSGAIDELDMLIQQERKTLEKKYRGFYWESDILDALDKVSQGNDKSRIMNAAVRRAFKDKGLL